MDFSIEFRKLDMTMGDNLLRSAKSCPCHLGGDKILTATTSTTTTTTTTQSTTTTSTTTTTKTSTTMVAISTTTVAPSTTSTLKTTSSTTTAVTVSSTTSIQSSTSVTTKSMTTTVQSTTEIPESTTSPEPSSSTTSTEASTSFTSTSVASTSLGSTSVASTTSSTAESTTTTVKEIVIEATKSRIEIKLDTTIPWSDEYLDLGSDEFRVLEDLVANLIGTAFVDEETPEYSFFPSPGTSGVTINLTLIVTVADEDQVIPEPSEETIARKAARGGVVTLRNVNFNLDTFLDNLETAVEESEVFQNIGRQLNKFLMKNDFLKLF